jgi:hypothetical protein
MWLVATLCVAGLWNVGCASAPPSPRAETLSTLHTSMQWVRAGRASEPRALEELPAVESLVGARRAEVQARLGTPRVCRVPVEAPCHVPGEVLWTFHRGHADHDAGPVLVLVVDGAGVVTEAHWRRPEVQVPPALHGSAGGEDVVATPSP